MALDNGLAPRGGGNVCLENRSISLKGGGEMRGDGWDSVHFSLIRGGIPSSYSKQYLPRV